MNGVAPSECAAIVLAAGAGSRFGDGKLTTALGGRPILQHVLDTAGETGLRPVIVVLGHSAEAVEARMRWRGELRVRNKAPERGLASSLKAGFRALDGETQGTEAALILLGDQPFVSRAVIGALLSEPVDAARPIVVPRYAADAAPNPVLLYRSAWDLVSEVAGDRGLGPLMAARPSLVRQVPVAGSNPDIDTPADLAALSAAVRGPEIPWRPTRDQLAEAHDRTVPDLIGPGLRVLLCGINPGRYSGAVGHHFARPGNRFWKALHRGGFTDRVLSPFEERLLLDAGIGVTNLVARTTATAAELADGELREGARLLRAKVEPYGPHFVGFLGFGAYRTAFGRGEAVPGRQPERLGRSGVWLLPNPSGLNAHYQLDDLGAAFRELRVAAEEADVSRDEESG